MGTRSTEHFIEIAAPVDRVWDAITNPTKLSQWILKGAEVDGRIGGLIKMDWGEEGLSDATIEEWDPPRRLTMQHLPWESAPPMPESGGPRDTYVLEAAGETTRLQLICSNVPTDSSWDEFFEGTKKGWPYFLSKLKDLLEE